MIPQLLIACALLDGLYAAPRPGPQFTARWTDGRVLNSSYLSPYFTQSREYIDAHTDYSIQSLVLSVNHTNGQFLGGTPDPIGNLFFWQSQNGWTAVAEWDHQRNQRAYFMDVITAQNGLARYPGEGLNQYGIPLVNSYNDDAGWAALANLEAYEAYGNEIFLKRAIKVYDFISTHGYIDQAVLDKGYYEGTKWPNNTLEAVCNGSSMIGGVYWKNGGVPPVDEELANSAADDVVGTVSTGNYGLLATQLCRLTGHMAYCDRAYETVWWMDRHMVDPETNLLWNDVRGNDCANTKWLFTYNIALYLGIYAELGHLTSNATATSLSERAIVAAMNTPQWNTPQGIIKESEGDDSESNDAIGFKSILLRYMHKAYYWISDQDVKNAIVQYINIQYYGMTHFAADSEVSPIRYTRNWTGPAFNISTQHAQLAALDTLNALELNPDSAFPSSADSSSPVISINNGTW